MHKFSIKEAVKKGWQAAIDNVGFFVVSLLVAFLVGIVLGPGPRHNFLAGIAGFLVGIVIKIGFLKIGLKLTEGHKPHQNDFFWPTKQQFWNYLFVTILCGVIIVAGFILLIVPGLIFLTMFQYAGFFVVQKGMNPIEALKASKAATEGSRWDVFLLDLTCLGIVILGAMAFGVGLFVAIPTVLVAQASVYRKLSA